MDDKNKVNVDYVLNEIKKLQTKSKSNNHPAFVNFTLREFNELFRDEDTLKELFINWKK